MHQISAIVQGLGLLLLLLLCSFPHACSSSSFGGDEEWTFDSVIPEDYNKAVPPGLALGNETTEATVAIIITSMDSISEKTMSFKCSMSIIVWWKDPRLKFPSDLTWKSQILPLEFLEHIWRPDLFISNAKDMAVPSALGSRSLIYERDTVLSYSIKFLATLSCPLDLRRYPHDTQTCKIVIESMAQQLDEVRFKWHDQYCVGFFSDGLGLNIYSKLKMVKQEAVHCNTQSLGSLDRYSCLEARFTFQRQIGHFVLNGYLPTILIVVVSWYSYWLKPESTLERVSLGITTLLTIYSQRVILASSLPEVSYPYAIDLFNLVSTFFVVLSILQFAVISVVIKDHGGSDDGDEKVDQEVEEDASTSAGKSTSSNLEVEWRRRYREAEERRARERARRYQWALRMDRFSRAAVPLAYVALSAAYWSAFYQPMPEGRALSPECSNSED